MRTRSGLFYEMANADQQPLEAPTVEAGVTTGGDAGFDPIPFNPSLNIRKYAGDEDPRQWITSLEEVGFLYRWADYIITRYAAMNLVGPAKTWYEFHKVNLATWEILKTRLIQDFASLENKDEMMLKLNRMQGWNELAMRFAEDILLQCSKVQPNMEEMKKIKFVIGGLKKEYALALYLNPPKTIDELLEACKRIDGFEKEYLERKEKNKILMNRISQKETNHARWNRQPREFQSYKTENYSRPMMGAPSRNQTYFPPQETRTFPRSTQKDTYRRTPSGNTYDRKPRNDRDGKRLNILGSISMDIKIDEKSLNYRFVVLESNMKSLIIGRDLLRRLNAKINCKQDILEYDIVTECQDSNEAPRKIINQQDEVVPQLCVKLVRVTVKANDGEYVVEPNEKLTLTNGLRIARCLITVRNKLADLWITNPYPRTLKIMKNQTLGYASPPTMVNNIEDDEEDKVTEIQINEDLTLSQKNELRQVLSKYSDLFSSKLGKTNLAKHRIDTENAKPIKHKPYRVSPKERDIIKEQIQDMLQEGVIRASSGPWAFPVILVRKRDGNWRFCVDYRKLNSITVKDVYPIPRIDDVMDTLQGSRYFTAIDLRSGYWQVEIEEQDKKKTAFTTSHGLYEFNVMPFGLCNAPATFERIMDNVLKNIKWKFCLCYLDDVIIYSPDFTTHLGRIEAVLKCFRESNLRLNGKKCRFGFEEIEILGHVTSKHGIKPADHNVKAIRDFPRPSKTKEIQSFIGLCSYYRKFIKNFSRIADPLFKLTRKDSPFIWSESQEEAFITLKSLLTNPPILSHFDPEAPTQIHTDASNIGLGATLVQTINGQEKVISYISRSLSKPERNYSTTEKECLALVWSMSKLRPYLYGRRFKVMTDHHALCWLRNLRDPTGRLARWALKIQEFDFEIIYKSGKKHLDADGLSRGPLPETDFDDNYDSLFFNPVIEDSDEYIENIKRCLGDTEGKRSIVENFKEENGCLYKRNPRPEGRAWLLVVPRVRRKDILKEHHNHMICGHLGVTRTMHRLKDKYFWPSMLKDVVEYVRTCHLCQSRKGSNQLPAGLLHPIPAANYPFERVGIDFLGPLPSTKNKKKWMIVLTDYYTKYAETKAVIDATAREVAKFLTENVILKHGAPRYLISDRGSQFTSNLVKEITKICQIQHCLTTSYHPQTNGLTERLNRTLINMISMYVNVDQRNWDEILPFITHAYNTTIQDTTKYSPFFLLYGREPVSILDDTNIFIEPDSEDYDEYVSKLMEKIVRTRDIVKVNTEKSQAKMINFYNQKHRQTGYEPGDLVALWTPIRIPGKCEKLLRRYFGPYIVLKKISDVNYSIVPEDNPGNRTQPTTVHISRIKPYFARIENAASLRTLTLCLDQLLNRESEEAITYDGDEPAAHFFSQLESQPNFHNLEPARQARKALSSLRGEPRKIAQDLALLNKTYEEVKEAEHLPPPWTRPHHILAVTVADNTGTHSVSSEGPTSGLFGPLHLRSTASSNPKDRLGLQVSTRPQQRRAREKPSNASFGSRTPPKLNEPTCTLNQHTPVISLRPYRTPYAYQKEIQDQISQLLKHGIITPSSSPYSSPVTLVRKRDNTMRLCIDFRRVNELVPSDLHPLPLIETVLDNLSKARVFSTVDISNAYYQIPITEESQPLLSFVTQQGQFNFKRLPFGFKSAPQIFERVITQLIHKHHLSFIAHYYDDFVIFSDSSEQHLTHLRLFFKFCLEENLQLNLKKCNFYQNEIDFLGYHITAGTYTPNIKNTEIINAIRTPINIKTLQSFLGAVNVYHKFIPEYARLRHPLNQLLKKNAKWLWSPNRQQAFDKLKQHLATQPVLHLFQEGLPCQVYCDASTQGIAGVLKQVHPVGNIYPVQYYSRALRSYERNYTISELECLAIVECVDKFRVYLLGTRFAIYSDHHALQWLKTIKDPTGRLFRWSLRLSAYDYEMTRLIAAQYYWDGMTNDIRTHVRTCSVCQLVKPPKGPIYGELGQLPPAVLPYDLVSLDTISGFAKYGNSQTFLHVVVDHATRYAWAFPSRSTSILTYTQVIKKVMQFGSPKRLLTDRAPAFTSPKFRRFLIRHNIGQLLTTSNNPQANGLSEPLNATITGKLKLLRLQQPKTAWTKLLSQVLQAYNHTPHSVTGFPPSYLLLGSFPLQLSEHVQNYPKIDDARELAYQRTHERHLRDKARFDQTHRASEFEVGDLVLAKTYTTQTP
ncbi:hypothetical protein LAZ67_16002321, partial [Cordylochernes scorpioides]